MQRIAPPTAESSDGLSDDNTFVTAIPTGFGNHRQNYPSSENQSRISTKNRNGLGTITASDTQNGKTKYP
ncbi:hypothetical protein AVEN_19422-1 [Araneus ventricosus]|uniref:Uncharacterized protein n=1 Tax=Araneus ventricosus TaxID=182803 RepID=A0A4Y2C8D8_ARAVE|nr:hypothetical protein AVEN_19422-1 [Araneus ventricosus]